MQTIIFYKLIYDIKKYINKILTVKINSKK